MIYDIVSNIDEGEIMPMQKVSQCVFKQRSRSAICIKILCRSSQEMINSVDEYD